MPEPLFDHATLLERSKARAYEVVRGLIPTQGRPGALIWAPDEPVSRSPSGS